MYRAKGETQALAEIVRETLFPDKSATPKPKGPEDEPRV
jgi:hypothetical protein